MAVSISISIVQNSQSIANNTSNVTVAVKASWTGGSYNLLEKSGWLTIDGTKYTFTSPFNTGRSTSGSTTLFSKTVNVTHNTNGAKTLATSASYTSGVSSGTVTASASKTLTTIPRKSSLSASNGTLGTAQNLTVTKQASSFTHTITYKCGTATGTVCTKSSNTTISWTPPMSLATQNTTGTTVSVTFTITTYNGNASVGSNTKSITCSIPASVKPSCSVTITETTNHASTYGAPVKGFSKFKITVTPTLAYSSAITSYSTSFDGTKYTKASFTTGAVMSSGTLTAKATVKDKRGRSGTGQASIAGVLDYTPPVIDTFTVHRCNEDGSANDEGDFIKVVVAYRVASLNDKNSCSAYVQYKKTAETEYGDVIDLELDNVYSVADKQVIFPADSGSSYNVFLSVADDLSTTTTTVNASTAFSIMHWGSDGRSLGLGKIAELPDVLDIGFKTRFFGGIIHPVLEPDTDLNNVQTPNTYVGANVSTHNYLNCPLTTGTFTLEVVGMGKDGQVKQRLTQCHKTESRAWERIYYSSEWGEWVCVSDFHGTLLWSDAYYMHAGQTADLSETVSAQKSGIELVFSEYYDGAADNTAFHTRFIPKALVAKHPGRGHCFQLSTSNLAYFSTKYLYVHDDKIVGHDNNQLTGTGGCGITYNNKRFVLRYVIGV